ncbi:MAG: hypothetical protein K2J03_00210, partial [Muribaculaceae bacterium]|nr:hypothetical protein [Muribaculaceae bacterium]
MRKRFEWIKQHDSMQCGVACLAMICRHYGREYDIDYLDEYCHASNTGVSLLGIKEGAEAVGLEATGVALSIDQLKELTLPCILHWNQNHFVVLYGISKNGNKYHIADPGKGLRVVDAAELEQHWISTVRHDVPAGVA